MKKSLIYSVFLCSVFMFFNVDTTAQNLIYLKKKHTAKTHKVMLHDVISVKLKGKKEIVKGSVTRIEEEGVLVDGYDFYYKDMEWIRTHHVFWKGVGKGLQYGGALFLGVFTINGAIAGYSQILSNGNLIFVGSLLLVGVVIELISFKTYKKSKGWMYEPVLIPVE